MPPTGVKLSCIEFTEPFDVPVVDAPQMPDATGPKRTSLPSMLPPGEFDVTACVTPPVSSFGLPPDSMMGAAMARAEPQHGHDGEDRVTLTLVLDHPAEGERQCERDDEDRVELEEVAQLRGVLERVRGVDVEEAATVGAELLDGDLARDRPAGDLLGRAR